VRPWLWIAVATLGVAVGAGAALGGTGAVDLSDEERFAELLPGEATYHLCPDDVSLGVFHGGDRVYVTGRDGSGAWVEVRAPEDLSARVWVRVQELDPDASLDGLPVVDCAFATGASPSTTSGATTPGTGEPSTTGPPGTAGDSTTSSAGMPTTTGPPDATTSTGFPTTTGPPDTTPPDISELRVNLPSIWEDGPSCSRLPRQATVAGTVTDADSAVAGVTLRWTIGEGTDDSTAMTSSATTWSATIGPFPPGTVDELGDAVVLTVTATDTAGNVATVEDFRLLRLEGCAS
jgi:hypothetical protein